VTGHDDRRLPEAVVGRRNQYPMARTVEPTAAVPPAASCQLFQVRMYLSSLRVGNCPGQLVRLARGGRRAAVIANAMDATPPQIRSEGVKRELDALTALGFVAEELDLRDYFGTGGPVASKLRRYDIGWLRGGNVFVLRYALARSGADAELTRLLGDDAIVYSGYSAGPCVLAPTLRGLETVDRAAVVEQLYGEQPIWEGLGVLDYSIAPHVNSPEHPESTALGLVAVGDDRAGFAIVGPIQTP
jgi:dipeptidase E